MTFFSLFPDTHENKNMSSGDFSVYVCLHGRLARFVKLVNEIKNILVIGMRPLRQIYTQCLLCYDFIISTDIKHPSNDVD